MMPDPLHMLLYVSRSLIPPDQADAEVERILAVARRRNLQARITGALLFSGARFAQALEGPAHAIDAVMADIERDGRHDELRTLYRREVATREFPSWSMAYVPRFPAAEGHIAAATRSDDDPSDTSTDALLAYMIAGSGARLD